MGRINRAWIVQPHGPIEPLDDGLWTVAGEIVMPLGRFPRRMTIAALPRGRVLVWSPVPLREAAMAELEALGRIAYLVVPGPAHRLDIAAWAARYPDAAVLCPNGAKAAVEEIVTTAAIPDELKSGAVVLGAVPGTGGREGALEVRREGRLSLILNDMVANVRHPAGIGAKIMGRLLGFGLSHPQIPRAVRRRFIASKPELARAYRHWAAQEGLVRIVPSHGEVIVRDPAAVLRRLAEGLV